MKKIALIVLIMHLMFACSQNHSDREGRDQQASTGNSASIDTSKKSIPSETKKWIGNTNITINYHSPGVRGRIIWGGLVPYNTIWVAGAHKATTLEVGKTFEIGDNKILAGKYAIFAIPGKKEWIIIINKNWNQHLTDDYSEKDDVVRVRVIPQTSAEIEERLKYIIDQTGERTATVIIRWEKIRVPFQIEVW